MMGTPLIAVLVFRKLAVYSGYLENVSVSLGILVPLKIAVFLAAILMKNQFKIKFCLHGNGDRKKTNQSALGMVGLYYFWGLVISGLGYFVRYADRISIYFYIFEPVFWGMLLSKKSFRFKYRQLFLAAVILLQLYKFLSVFRGSGQGVVPYCFIWQS